MKKFLRPIDLARAVGVSTQVVRVYERMEFLPTAERSAKGYRLYTQLHLDALLVARRMMACYGWGNTQQIMHAIHQADLPTALAIIDARHAEIHQNRREIEETLRILHETSTAIQPIAQAGEWRRVRTALHVSEAAQNAGVRPSALRYWEGLGLLHPTREEWSSYRLYDAEQMRNIQIVALLRKADYDVETIRTVLTQLATGTPEQALTAAENRLKELTEVSRSCLEATAALYHYIENFTSQNNHP